MLPFQGRSSQLLSGKFFLLLMAANESSRLRQARVGSSRNRAQNINPGSRARVYIYNIFYFFKYIYFLF